MEEKKYIQLEEVIDVCQKFINKEITQEELEEWGNTIVVQKFLPMELKAKVVDFLINDCYYSENSVDKVVELECNKFWYVLLLYTNINIEGKEEEYQ